MDLDDVLLIPDSLLEDVEQVSEDEVDESLAELGVVDVPEEGLEEFDGGCVD